MWQLFAVLVFGSATAAAARGIYVLSDSPLAMALLEAESSGPSPSPGQSQAQAQPEYEIPHPWGGPVPSELRVVSGLDEGDDTPSYPAPPDPGPVVAGELGPFANLNAPVMPVSAQTPAAEDSVTPSGSDPSGNKITAPEPPIAQTEPPTKPIGLQPPEYSRVVDLLELCPFEPQGTFGTDEWELFAALKAAGRNQGQIIKTMWGISKNGSAKYTQARDRYIALAETWHQLKILENKQS